ncbi:hypothetical protein [Wolbachia endosymbiont of Chironomus riparius]|uniref:hypothetical protein n=1 Tax=Wolbachia endosymbiont of Chironomus riparius TaxID=2883238 RepID=UPI0020A15C86|nr:hypothetical protein [Wolbachia endosymbiont of Chironomus riparius]
MFNINKDFEDNVLIEVKKLLNANATLNKYDEEFALIRVVVNYFHSIHKIKIDKDITLLFSIGNDYKELSLSNKTIKKEIMIIRESPLLNQYITSLTKIIQLCIEIKNENGVKKYVAEYKEIGLLKIQFDHFIEESKKYNDNFIYPKNIKNTVTKLLKNQDSDNFENMMVNPENINYLAPQKGNNCLQDFNKKVREKYINIGCKFIVSAFVLSIGLCTIDYLLMEQKLLSPIKNILPQDNITNLVIVAVFVIIMVAAVSELCKPQLQISEHNVNNIDIPKKELANGHS